MPGTRILATRTFSVNNINVEGVLFIFYQIPNIGMFWSLSTPQVGNSLNNETKRVNALI